jgi:hypothetical protein
VDPGSSGQGPVAGYCEYSDEPWDSGAMDLVGWLVGWLLACLLGRSVGWLVGGLVS